MMQRGFFRGAWLLLVPVLLGACVSVDLGGGEDRPLSYVLSDARPVMDTQRDSLPVTVIIQGLSGDPLANSSSIAYALAPGQREVYLLSRWTERPAIAIPRLLMQRLTNRGGFQAVAVLGEGIGGELGLGVAIESIYHDARSSPGTAIIVLRADLIDRSTRELLSRRQFNAEVNLSAIGPASLVDAMGEAVAQVFDALVPWLESESARSLHQGQ